MNICFLYTVAFDPEKGGVEKVTCVLADALIQRGYDVSFLSMTDTYRETSDKGKQYFFPNKTRLSHENELFFEKFICEKKIDIIIFQAGQDKRFPFPHILKRNGVRLISAVHMNPIFYKPLVLQKFILKYGNTAAKICRPVIAIKTLFRKRKQAKLYRTNTHYADKVVVLSEKYIPDYNSHLPDRDRVKVEAIPNPLSFKYQTEVSPKKNEVLYVGRMNLNQKRVDLLLKIWSLVQDDFPEWTLRLVGGGSDADHLKEIARNLNLKNISFEGFQDPIPFYRSAKVFCLTSADEGFGLVLLEASAFGCIPIAFDSYPVASEIIQDGKNGFLIPPFDVECYAKKLAELMTNYPTEIAENAKENVKRYALEPIVSKWIALFEEVMKDGKRN